jgi:hypothetical protein
MLKASERSFERPVERPQAGGSLAFLMDSYSSEARKRERSVNFSFMRYDHKIFKSVF